MTSISNIDVEVVFATKEHQWLKQVSVAKGSSAIDAVRASGLDIHYAAEVGEEAAWSLGFLVSQCRLTIYCGKEIELSCIDH